MNDKNLLPQDDLSHMELPLDTQSRRCHGITWPNISTNICAACRQNDVFGVTRFIFLEFCLVVKNDMRNKHLDWQHRQSLVSLVELIKSFVILIFHNIIPIFLDKICFFFQFHNIVTSIILRRNWLHTEMKVCYMRTVYISDKNVQSNPRSNCDSTLFLDQQMNANLVTDIVVYFKKVLE
jgi:hypothetical protein